MESDSIVDVDAVIGSIELVNIIGYFIHSFIGSIQLVNVDAITIED